MGGVQSFERNGGGADQTYGRTKITETANFDFRNENLKRSTTLERTSFCEEVNVKKESWLDQHDAEEKLRRDSEGYSSFFEQLDNSSPGYRSNKSSTSSRFSTSSTDSGLDVARHLESIEGSSRRSGVRFINHPNSSYHQNS